MPPPEISVVAPTFREAENIPALVARIAAALRGREYEIIIADDVSGDGTDAVCAGLSESLPLRLLSRRGARGLSPAVMDGIAAARGEFVAVLDADLSHPPEKIPELVALLQNDSADFVVGSRYVRGGGTADDWPLLRRLNSRGATILARPLTPLADPMSGFFAFRRAQMPPPETLSPVGYKIGLEIAVKAGYSRRRIAEVPIFFGDRRAGESKMTPREQWNYLRHLRRLYHHKWPKKMEALQFAAVGGIGFVWDALAYFALQAAGMPHLWARALAFWPGVTHNWFLNRVMTFKTRPRISAAKQWAGFVAVSSAGFCINWGVYALLTLHTSFFARHHFAAFVVGVLAGAVFNFVAADRLVFPQKSARAQ
ncbi:MAG: glycosyltransferase [Gammaproteobacteria bacterium]